MLLSSVQQREIARKADWKLDCNFGRNTQDSVVLTGDGVDDLDRAIGILSGNTLQPGFRLLIDLGTQFSSYRPFDLEDLQAIRGFYVGFYGESFKPVFGPSVQGKAVGL